MRISFVIQNLSTGGAERVASMLANRWSELGHEVTLLTFEAPGALSHYPLGPNVRLRQLDLFKPPRAGFIGTNLKRVRRLRTAIEASGSEVVVSFLTEANVPAILAARSAGVPVVVSERVHPGYHHIGRLRNLLRRLAYPLADAVVVQTKGIADWMDSQLGLICEVIPNPITPPLKTLASVNTDLGRPCRLLAAGRLAPQKGFDLLIEAFARVAEDFPSWNLIIYGEGSERSSLEAAISAHGMNGRISLPGITKDLPAVLNTADIFVHPARYEGFANVLLEALSAGCACIATDSPGGAREILQDGRYGRLVPPEDVDALSQALSMLMGDARARERYAAHSAGALKALKLDRIAGLWLGLFNGLLRRRKGGGGEVMMVINQLGEGGAERHLTWLVPTLHRRGLAPLVFNLSGRGRNGLELLAQGVPVLRPLPSLFISMSPRPLRRLLGRLQGAAALYACLRREKPPIAHFFLPEGYLTGAPVSWAARVPWRLMSRRSLNRYARHHRLAHAFERLLHRTLALSLANSHAVAAELIREGVPPERLRVLYNGIEAGTLDPDRRPAIRAQLGISDKSLVFVIVANLYPYKGHRDLLQALARIRDSLPRDWVLLCIGRDEGEGAELAVLGETLGISSNIRWLGERTDARELLAAADVSLLCSYEEGFSNSILEGMATGLPMVVTDVGGNAEAVLDGESGLVVPAANPAALAEALLQLAGDSELRARLGRAARKRVLARFTLERCADRYLELYQAMVRGEKPPSLDGVGDMHGVSVHAGRPS